MQNSKPGVMVYFNLVEPFLEQMTDEQAGALFRALVNYANGGIVGELDAITSIAFGLMRPAIDRDNEKYFETVQKRKYATYCRETEKNGETTLPFPDWLRYRETSHDIK